MIRKSGTVKGLICDGNMTDVEALRKISDTPENITEIISTKQIYPSPGRGHRIVIIDFGMKHGILRNFTRRDCNIIVMPHHVSGKEVFNQHPDGIVLSGGPGNPYDLPYAVELIKEFLGKVPVFGIGLGHQLLAIACSLSVEKMQTGHRSTSHPVKELVSDKVLLTSQNHGYTVIKESVENTEMEITHLSLHDGRGVKT